MLKPTRILVPTDFSEASQDALNYACALAAGFDADVHVIHVITDPEVGRWSVDTGSLPREYERKERAAEERLERLLKACNGAKDRVTFTVDSGSAPDQILKHADSLAADLIVMGSRGLGALQQAIMGSVAEKVVRYAHCPVLVVRRPRGVAAPTRPVETFETAAVPHQVGEQR
jgi:nucleotide-binding universal stress UspA family protein